MNNWQHKCSSLFEVQTDTCDFIQEKKKRDPAHFVTTYLWFIHAFLWITGGFVRVWRVVASCLLPEAGLELVSLKLVSLQRGALGCHFSEPAPVCRLLNTEWQTQPRRTRTQRHMSRLKIVKRACRARALAFALYQRRTWCVGVCVRSRLTGIRAQTPFEETSSQERVNANVTLITSCFCLRISRPLSSCFTLFERAAWWMLSDQQTSLICPAHTAFLCHRSIFDLLKATFLGKEVQHFEFAFNYDPLCLHNFTDHNKD